MSSCRTTLTKRSIVPPFSASLEAPRFNRPAARIAGDWQTETFRKWRERLRDRRAKAIIGGCLERLARGSQGDAKLVGDGVSELRIHYGTGYRVYYQQRGETIVVLLCGGDKGTQEKDIRTAKRLAGEAKAEWKSGANEMAEKLTRFDPAEHLKDKEDVEWFLADALRTNDAAFVAHCLSVVARSSGMRQIAKETGLSHEQLYRSLSAEGNPTLKTVLAVINSLGLELTAKAHEIDAEEARVKARDKAKKKPRLERV
jgi:putative addiction module killer protein/probable addiction module antidote protein